MSTSPIQHHNQHPNPSSAVEKTNNRMGFMFNKIGVSAHYWLSSLPTSPNPLLDLGAAYGVHTLHALSHGYDVIALDCDETHLRVLRERVQQSMEQAVKEGRTIGRLVGTLLGRLPCGQLLKEESVAGVLLSEVVHFMLPEVVAEVFNDVYRWLEPGGRLVVTAVGMAFLRRLIESNWYRMGAGRTVEEALELVERGGDDDVLKGTPGLVFTTEEYKFRHQMPEWVCSLSKRELSLHARRAGFVVEKVEYIATGKYPSFSSGDGITDTVLLVARK